MKRFPICYVVISENVCRRYDNILGKDVVFMCCYQLCLDRLFVAFLCGKRGSCSAPSGEQTMLYQHTHHGWWVFLASLLYAVVIYQSYVINTSSISSNLLPTGQTTHVFPKRPPGGRWPVSRPSQPSVATSALTWRRRCLQLITNHKRVTGPSKRMILLRKAKHI